MVLRRRPSAPRPALIVPDELSWTMWGHDCAQRGLHPASPEQAHVLRAPTRLPAPLGAAVAAAWLRAPDGAQVETRTAPHVEGVPLERVLAADAVAGHGAAAEQAEGHAGASECVAVGAHDAPARHGADSGQRNDHADETAHAGHGGIDPLPGAERGALAGADRAGDDVEDGHGETEAAHEGSHGHGDHGVRARAGHTDPPSHHDHGDGTHHEHEAHAEHAGHADHGGHGGHDHHDMMAIVGDPSADGLVMEPIEFEFGPLSGVLPGGLVVAVELDGDVVSDCSVRATLHVESSDRAPWPPPDPLAPAAWTTAAMAARDWTAGVPARAPVQWRRLAAVEFERALSHLAWLRSLARLLGWAQLVDATQDALRPLLDAPGPRGPQLAPSEQPPMARGDDAQGFAAAGRAVANMAELLAGRRFAGRARGRGLVAGAAELPGPNGRAAGGRADARTGDPLYGALGFRVAVRDDGDVLARTLVRVDETVEAIRLAGDALARAEAEDDGDGATMAFVDARGAVVEAPRGPVRIDRLSPDELVLAAPGAELARGTAARAAVGQEWSAALLTLASFDLSPWRVAG